MDSEKESAELDRAVSIGYGQTISQPTLVLEMTLHLSLESDSKVLEIGTGSGFQTALLAQFADTVYTVERIEALYHNAKERLSSLGFPNIHFLHGDGNNGWDAHAPYDRIMVTAAARKVPAALLEQLSPGGKMVIPVGDAFSQELQLIEKDHSENIHTTFIEHVLFVEFKKDTE
jgi:protein-L-isoaspartate(D-aspartate) O-methyltransferase